MVVKRIPSFSQTVMYSSYIWKDISIINKVCVSIRVWSKVLTEVREPVLSELTWHYRE